MKTYDDMFRAALGNYGNIEEDRVAAATLLIATKDGLKPVTAVVDLDYQPKAVVDVPEKDRASNGETAFIAVRARTACSNRFRVYKTRTVDFMAWTFRGTLYMRAAETESFRLAYFGTAAEDNEVVTSCPTEAYAEAALQYIIKEEVTK